MMSQLRSSISTYMFVHRWGITCIEICTMTDEEFEVLSTHKEWLDDLLVIMILSLFIIHCWLKAFFSTTKLILNVLPNSKYQETHGTKAFYFSGTIRAKLLGTHKKIVHDLLAIMILLIFSSFTAE